MSAPSPFFIVRGPLACTAHGVCWRSSAVSSSPGELCLLSTVSVNSLALSSDLSTAHPLNEPSTTSYNDVYCIKIFLKIKSLTKEFDHFTMRKQSCEKTEVCNLIQALCKMTCTKASRGILFGFYICI